MSRRCSLAWRCQASRSTQPAITTENHETRGEYEVHYIGVNWPHHIFVNQDFKVVGAG
jgi:hypothetical protein